MHEVDAEVLEGLQWLGAFARRLANDADDADDLVQDTLVTAWTQPPADRTEMRPWLATVLRNRLRMQQRTDARREARETAHGSEVAADPAPDQAVARIRVLRQLTAELERLNADDQQLIVLRFLHGQSAAEIARALSIPAGTVRSRISRLLAALRERLDTSCDGRDAWCAAVVAVPTAGPTAATSTSATTQGSNTMLKTTLIIAVAGATGLGAYAGLSGTDATTEASATVAEASDATAALDVAETPQTGTSPRTVSTTGTAPDARQQWQHRRAALERSLKENPPAGAAPTKTDTRREYARLVVACVRDIENQPAKFSLEITEVGAPDIGTIVSEVEVFNTTVTNPEIIECAEQSMYAYVGPAPAVAFKRTFRMGMKMGGPKRADGDLEIRFHFYMDANFEDVRACEPDGIKGEIELDVTGDAEGKVTTVKVVRSTVDADVDSCIRKAVRTWTFPEPVATKTRRHRYFLPVQDLKIME